MESDRKFGTYQFVYFMADRQTCKNARGSKILAAVCLKDAHLTGNKIDLPFDIKYFILMGVFSITFTLWAVTTKCGNIRNRTRNCCNSHVNYDVE